MRHTLAWGVVAAGAVAAGALGVTLLLAPAGQQATAPPSAPSPTAEAPSVPPTAAPDDAPATMAPVTPQRSEIGVRSARIGDVGGDDAPAPVRVSIAAIGITGAPVDPVGVEPDGGMEVPADVSRVGWYRYGPEPGASAGTAVLTAHIDDRTQGQGVFYDLDGLRAGDGIAVEMADGSLRRFTVDGTRQIPKVDLPTGALFRRDGRPRLALITCGGTFDAAGRQYRDNIVVLASPS